MNHYPAMPALIMAVMALFAKFVIIGIVQTIGRARSSIAGAANDVVLTSMNSVAIEPLSFTGRCINLWRHQARNIPLSFLFIALAVSYVLLGAPLQSAQVLFISFILLCYLDCFMYLTLPRRWSVVAYLAAWIICWILAVQLVKLMFWHW